MEPLLSLVKTAYYQLKAEADELAARAAEKTEKGYNTRSKTSARQSTMENFVARIFEGLQEQKARRGRLLSVASHAAPGM